MSVAFLSGDQRQTQILEEFDLLYSDSFPTLYVRNELHGDSKVEEYAAVDIDDVEAAQLNSLRLGLFQDQKLLAWYEHLYELPYDNSGRDVQWFRLDGEWTMEPDHVYCLAAVIEDKYGREHMYASIPVKYDPARGLMDFYVPDGIYEAQPDLLGWEY